MRSRTTAEVMERFNHAFVDHDPDALTDLVGDDCVMEAIQPAPDGARYEGREACLAFWRALAEDRATQFEPEDVAVDGDRATIRWRYRFGDGPADSVRGVNLMRVRDGLVIEALGYSKTAGDVPLAAELPGPPVEDRLAQDGRVIAGD
jgi:ketosteroid isomerase-like protein